MKWLINAKLWLLATSLAMQQSTVFAQDSSHFQIISPFDSVSLSDVTAIGNPETGSVEVTMRVFSKYHRLASISFGAAGFGDFGATDDMGVKYKYSSYDGPPGVSYGVNKGYSRIADLLFGKSKVIILVSVQDTFHAGQSKTLKFRLMKVNKAVSLIKEIHLLCTVTLDYMLAGQKQYFIKNIPVEWVKPKPRPEK